MLVAYTLGADVAALVLYVPFSYAQAQRYESQPHAQRDIRYHFGKLFGMHALGVQAM